MMNVLGTLMSRGVMHVKETIYRIRNKIRLKGIGFLDSFVDTLLSTTPHHGGFATLPLVKPVIWFVRVVVN